MPTVEPSWFSTLTTAEFIWLGIGFLGQALFFGRWVLQWVVSERHQESRVPIGFWYLSLTGGLITLAYAIYRKDPVFIAGQSIGATVYFRNLMLLHRTSREMNARGSQNSHPQEPGIPGG